MKKIAMMVVILVLIGLVVSQAKAGDRMQKQSAVIRVPGPQPSEMGPVAAGVGVGLLARSLVGLNPLAAAGVGVLTFGIADELRCQRIKNEYQNYQETIWGCIDYPDGRRECRQETSGIQITTGKKNVQPPYPVK
jgi:hypothetical protein